MTSRFAKTIKDDDFFDDLLDDVAGGYQPSSMKDQKKPQSKHEVDDLLDLLDRDHTTSKPLTRNIQSQRPQSSVPYTHSDDFFQDLDDNQLLDGPAISTYVQPRRNRPETANPTIKLNDTNKNKMAELFGVKANETEHSKQPSSEEINTLDIGVSRRRERRILSRKEGDQDSQNKSVNPNGNEPQLQNDDGGSMPDDQNEVSVTKSRMRPPLNKRISSTANSNQVKPPIIRNRGDSQDQELSPKTDQILRTQGVVEQKSFNDMNNFGGEKSFDKMSNLLPQDDSGIQAPPLLKQDYQNKFSKPDLVSQGAHQQMAAAYQKQIDFLEQQLKSYKQEKEEQVQHLLAVHQQQLESERKVRVEIVNQLQDMMEKERKRMQEQQKEEIERVRKEDELDKQRALEFIRHEPQVIKQQIEQQYKLNELFDQLKSHTSNFDLLQKQFQHNNAMSLSEKEAYQAQRENNIIELEKKLQQDMYLIEQERLKITHQQNDLKQRQQAEELKNETEKAAIRSELKRLGDMQDQVRNLELQSKKLLSIEREQVIAQRQQIQSQQIRQELEKQQEELGNSHFQKMKDFEIEKTGYENQKEQFRQFSLQTNEEIDEAHEKIAQKETDLMQRQSKVDLKEHETNKMYNELGRKITLIEQERNELHRKFRDVSEREQKITEGMVGVNDFRETYQAEKQQIEQKKQDLYLKEKKVQQDKEKKQLNQMHQTLSNLRNDIAQQPMAQTAQTGFYDKPSDELPQRPMVLTAGNFSQFKKDVKPSNIKMKSQNNEKAGSSNGQSKFELNNYTNFLKKAGQSTNNNQIYHIKERGNLTSSGFNESAY